MAVQEAGPQGSGGYVVLHEVEPGHWVVVGDVDRRPGLTARNSRAARSPRTPRGPAPTSHCSAVAGAGPGFSPACRG